MSSARKEIREAVVDALFGATDADSRVYDDRTTPLADDDELPAILVYSRREESRRTGQGSSPLTRTLEMIIEGRTIGENIDDAMDDLAAEIESAMLVDTTLDSRALTLYLKNTEMDASSSGEKPIGTVLMAFEITYIS